MANAILSVILEGKNKTSAAVNEAKGGLEGLKTTVSNFGKEALKTGGLVTAGITTPIVAMGIKAVSAGSDLQESLSKAGVVFGENAAQITDWSTTAATAFGITQQQALESAGTFGNLFTAMGIGAQPTAEMSTGLVQLAADLASFNNIDPTEALEKLRAGMVGEAEPLRTLGVNLTAADTQARAMAMGLAASTEELTPAMLAQARYSLILEQTALAQGDFARTSDGLANQSRILKAQIGDLAAKIGSALLPIAQTIIGKIGELVSWFTNLDPKVQQVILVLAGLAAAAGPVIIALGTVATVVGAIALPIGLIVVAVAALAAAWATDFGGIRTTVTEFWNTTVQPIFNTLVGWLQENIPVALETLARFWDETLLPAITAVWEFLEQYVFPVIETLINVYIALAKAELEALARFWDAVLKPAIETVWAFIQTNLIPIFETLLAWLAENIPVALASLAGFWEGTLKPAIETVWAFIQGNLIPIFETVLTWLADNIPPALETLAGFWEGTLKPAIEAVWEFIQGNLIPIFETVLTWLADNIPPALETLARFWDETLKPAIETVWEFIQNDVIPLFETLVDVGIAVLQLALAALAMVWENILKPAIEKVWKFIDENILPIFTKLVDIYIDNLKTALDELTKLWKETLQPALEDVWKFLKDNLIKTFVDLKAKLDGPVTTALNAISGVFDNVAGAIGAMSGVIQGVIGWLQSLIDKVNAAIAALGSLGGGGGNGRGLEQTRDVLKDIVPLLDDFGGSLADLKPTAGDLQVVSNALLAMVNALTAVAGYGNAQVGPNLQRLIDQFGAVVRKLQRAAAEFGAEGLAAAVALGEAMGKIGNGLKAAVDGLDAVAGYTEAKVGPNLQRLIDQYVEVIRKLVRAAAEFDELGYQAAERLAAAMGAIGSKLKNAVDGLTAIAGYVVSRRMALAVEQFVDDWSRMIAALVGAGDEFDDKGLTAAERLASAMGEIGSKLKKAVDGLLAIAGYGSNLDFVVQMQRFVDDLVALARAMAQAVVALGDDVLKQLERAALFAEPIKQLVSVVTGGLEALTALASYTSSAGRGGIAFTARRFARDLVSLAEELRRAFNTLPDDLLIVYDSAVAFADRIDRLVGVVKPGMDAVLALAAYTQANNLAQAVTAFAGDVLVVAEGLREALGSLPQATLENYDLAVEFAQRIQALVGFIQPAMAALQELSRYGGGAATALHAGMEKLTRNVASLINFLSSHYQVLGGDAVAQAQTFAESIVAIVTAIRRGLEDAASIEGLNATYDGSFVVGQNWITGIVDGITSRLSDLEDLMAYIRGLFPSSPAKYGPWTDLPMGNEVAQRWLAGMSREMQRTSELERSLAGVRGLYAGAGSGAYAGPPSTGSGYGFGGGSVTVNVSMMGPFNVRQDADIEQIAQRVGDVLAQKAGLTRRMGLQRV